MGATERCDSRAGGRTRRGAAWHGGDQKLWSAPNRGLHLSKTVQRVALVAFLGAALAGCGALPSDGPLSATIVSDQGRADTTGYEIIDIDSVALQALGNFSRKSLERTFGNTSPAPRQTVRIGDTLGVAIWEASSGGLFSGVSSGTGSRAENLPTQIVDATGHIMMPFVGRIHVAGLTPAAVAKLAEQKLQGKAIEPQVLVTIQNSVGSAATISGDVTGSARVPLSPKGDRLMEVIALGGGVKSPPHETFIRVTRGSRTSTVSLATVLDRPAENIYIHPGDLIHVYRQAQTFTALGALTKPGEVPIDRENFTLAQALGMTGGLNDRLADTGGVFLFRYEQPSVVRNIRPQSPLLEGGRAIPVIYRLSFATPAAYFLAKSFVVNSQDLVYVANAPSVEFMKFLDVVRAATSSVAVSRQVYVQMSQ